MERVLFDGTFGSLLMDSEVRNERIDRTCEIFSKHGKRGTDSQISIA